MPSDLRSPDSASPSASQAATRRIERMDWLVGNTPILRLRRTGAPDGAPIFVKLENTNPSGSIRDRYVLEIVQRAVLAGQLVAGDTVSIAGIDDSAVAAAFLASVSDLKLRVFAPRGSSQRLVPLIIRYGAEIEWTDDADGLQGAIDRAAAWARDPADRMYIDGYRRQAVADSYGDMAREIFTALGEATLGAFVTSVTTGGTFREVSRELRETQPTLVVGGVQIIENEFATNEDIEHVTKVTLAETFEMRDQLARTEGLLVGPKGAACVIRALELQDSLLPDQAIIALNPNAGQRYLGWEDKDLYRATF